MIEFEVNNELVMFIILNSCLVSIIIIGIIYNVSIFNIIIYCFIVLGVAGIIDIIYRIL